MRHSHKPHLVFGEHLTLAVLLFMRPVPRSAISPKQTPTPNVTFWTGSNECTPSLTFPACISFHFSLTKTTESSGPPTTWTCPVVMMNISLPTSPFWQM